MTRKSRQNHSTEKETPTHCDVFGHDYDPRTGICRECGDDGLLKEMMKKEQK